MSTCVSDLVGKPTSMRVRFGTRALTSRMILGLAPASKDLSMTLKTVFSLGFSLACTKQNKLI